MGAEERAERAAEAGCGEQAVTEQEAQAEQCQEDEVDFITPDWCALITTNPKTGLKQWEMVVDVPALQSETSRAELVWLDEMQQAGVLHLTVYPYRLHLPVKDLGMPPGFDFFSTAVMCSVRRPSVPSQSRPRVGLCYGCAVIRFSLHACAWQLSVCPTLTSPLSRFFFFLVSGSQGKIRIKFPEEVNLSDVE